MRPLITLLALLVFIDPSIPAVIAAEGVASEVPEPGAVAELPAGWRREATRLDDAGLTDAQRFRSPSGKLILYLAHRPARPRKALDAWLEDFNRRRDFDEGGSRAFTLMPADARRLADGRLRHQQVLIESDAHEPFAVETYALRRRDRPLRWAALIDVHEPDAADRDAERATAARLLRADRYYPEPR